MSERRGRRSRRRVSEAAPAPSSVETTVFRSGNSDAVRLPTRYGLHGKRVRVRRLPDGRFLIEPVRKRRWPVGFLDSFGGVTDDYEAPPRPSPDADRDARRSGSFDDGDDE